MNFEILYISLRRTFFITLTRLAIVVFAFFLVTAKTQAQSSNFLINNPSITVQLSEDNSALIMQSFNLTNTAVNGELLNAYKLVIPFTKVQNVELKINGAALQFESTENTMLGITEIGIIFPQPLFGSQSVQMHIQYQLTDYIQNAVNTRFFLFGNETVRDYDKYTNITLLIPQSFGEISLTSLSNIPESTNVGSLKKIDLINPDKVFFIMWGEQYKLQVSQESQLNNITKQPIQTLYQIIPSITGQIVNYTAQIAQSEYGVTDEFGNMFAAIQLDSEATKPTGYNAMITKELTDLQHIKVTQDLPFELIGNGLLQTILKDITEVNTSNAFYESYNYVISNYKAVSITTDFISNEQFWDRINSSNELNSFEFCGILSAVAKELDMNHAIQYGYLSFYPTQIAQRSPHFWCIFEVEGQKLLFDPFIENAIGMRFTNQKSDFDRIVVGNWNQQIAPYSNSLGLTADQSEIQQITIDTNVFENDLDTNQLIDFSVSITETVYAGFDFSAELIIQNTSGKALPIASLIFNSMDITSGIELRLPNSQYTVLPYKESIIFVTKIREPNFAINGLRASEISLEFSDPSQTIINKTIFVQFFIYSPIILLVSVVIIFIGAMIFVIFYFVYKKRTHALNA